MGDRGMVTRSVAEKIKGVEGLHTISTLTHPEIFALVERKVINADLQAPRERGGNRIARRSDSPTIQNGQVRSLGSDPETIDVEF